MLPIQCVVVFCATLAAMITDIQSRKIPNKITGPFFLAGLIWAFSVAGWVGVGDSLAGALIAGLPFVFLFIIAGGGAGDAKLMGAIGAWMGITGGLVVMLTVAVVGGVFAIIWALMQNKLRQAGVAFGYMITNLLTRVRGVGKWAGNIDGLASAEIKPMPYGVSIFVGTLVSSGIMYLWQT
ncbi:MAG: A24 family peptidase [Planctomycetota bacterium]